LTSFFQTIFVIVCSHFRGKFKSSQYPTERALRLIEVISRDLQTQMLKVLASRQLMFLPISEFNKVGSLSNLKCAYRTGTLSL
jgi:hypothetical protein